MSTLMLLPLGAALGGSAMSLVASILAASGTNTDIAPYVNGAGSGLAVVGLVFILRAVLSGSLVARPVADVEAKLFAVIADCHALAEDSQRREKAYEAAMKRRAR